jgi:protein-S-isoprenylcysteine O-methyltransferase Ste14
MHISEVIFIAGFVTYILIRGIFEHRLKHAPGFVIKGADRRETILLVVMSIGLILPLIYVFTPLLAFADYRLAAAAAYAGTPIMLVALWLFWRSHSDLGEYWSRTLKIREGHKLITHGIYRRVRHPMYAAIWLFSLAQALLLQNWLAGWSALVTFAILYFSRVGDEERMMEKQFGKEYRDYGSRTGRLFPKIRSRP